MMFARCARFRFAALRLLVVRSLRSLLVRSLRSLIAFVMGGFLASPVRAWH